MSFTEFSNSKSRKSERLSGVVQKFDHGMTGSRATGLWDSVPQPFF